ncbi:MAG: 7TM diverse intracellular signaling domain-containing protein, partial [Bacteroidota bacterium]
ERFFHRIWFYFIIGASWIFSAFVVLFPPLVFTYSIIPFEMITIISGGYFCLILWKSYIHQQEETLAFAIGFLILFLTVINDILFNNEIINTSNLGQLGLFFFIFAQSFMLSQKFSRAFKSSEMLAQRLDNINHDLEQEISVRTKDLAGANRALQKTYEKVKRKNQELEKLNDFLEQAREQNVKFFSLIENTSDFVFLADMQGELVYCNQAFRHFMKDAPEESLPKNIRDLNRFLSSNQHLEELNEILLREGLVKQEVLINHPLQSRPLDMDGLAFYIKAEGSEESLGIAMVLRDITDLKKSERMVRQANEEIYRKSREIIAQKQALEEAYQDIEQLSEVGRKITQNLSLDKILPGPASEQ